MNYKELKYDRFPAKLKNIKNPPKKLYILGNEKLLYENCFGIVGSRKITEYGIKNCEYFTKEIVLRDIPTVSGMAIGTDSIVHKTTLEYSGKTIAVLGSGFRNIYPEKNIILFNEIIAKDGLVVTEYELDEKPKKENFPKRNRIITALSEGILVIEAAYRSGTSITANKAIEQGKKVFAVPSSLDNYLGVGVNNLIKKGAILTTNINDIIEHYPQFIIKMRKTIYKKDNICLKIKDEYKEIYNILKNKPLFLEEIKTKLETKELLIMLTNMELDGLIKQEADGKYILKEMNL